MKTDLTIWLITNGAKGMDVQAQGIADALIQARGGKSRLIHVTPHWLWGIFAPFYPALFGAWQDPLIAPPFPDIAISVGRSGVPYTRYIRTAAAGDCFCVHLQNPQIAAHYFDMVWAPAHDSITGANVIKTLLSPHGLTATHIKAEAQKWQHICPPESVGKRLGVLIGGANKAYDFTPDERQSLALKLADLCGQGWYPLITLSRRTPADYAAMLRASLPQDRFYLFSKGEENPYHAILGLSDQLIVTADSVNMMGEALIAGKPTYIFELAGKPSKFSHFQTALYREGLARPFTGQLTEWQNPPRNDTDIITAKILAGYEAWNHGR